MLLVIGGCGRGGGAAPGDAGMGGAADLAAETAVADSSAGPDGATSARASAGCGASPLYRPGSQTGSLTVAGRMRSFVVHVPPAPGPGRPAPLVVLLHGGLGTGAQLEQGTGFSPIADRDGVVAVYPDGLNQAWNAGRCCGPPAEQNFDDVGFIADLLDHLESTLCIDRRRIYATGMSNGGMMAHRLGCDLAERFAAIAPVAGPNMANTCMPKRPVPVMHIHGSADQHARWDGGEGCGVAGVPFTSVPETLSGWLARNGCTRAAPSLFVAQGNGRCERQGQCPPGADVILCTIAGGGHSWPGGEAPALRLPACTRAGEGDHSTTFIASEQIWAFLQMHALP
jgi:polyhydroxybutyrate depolymerase